MVVLLNDALIYSFSNIYYTHIRVLLCDGRKLLAIFTDTCNTEFTDLRKTFKYL